MKGIKPRNITKLHSRKLPLLELEKTHFSNIDLSKTVIICVQHLCSTTYALFNSLFDLGLEKENLFVLGKCYSTDPKIYFQLIRDGVHVSPASTQFNSHISYDKEFEQSIELLLDDFLKSCNPDKYEKVIILDDGGHLLEKAIEFFPDKFNLIGVEQTSSGYNRVKSKFLPFPVVNTARSWLKLEYESPIIVKLFKKKLYDTLNQYTSASKKMLIIGNGALGQLTYENLKDLFEIKIFDLDVEKSDFTTTEFKHHLKDFDIIIGCTGHTSLVFSNFKNLKKGVVLASISSSDREFDAVYLRRHHDLYHNCHKNICVNGINLLNSGFPITFGNDYNVIDTDDFQLTRALLFSSICQAYLEKKGRKSGFIDLENDIQFRILNNLHKIKHEKSKRNYIHYRRFARAG